MSKQAKLVEENSEISISYQLKRMDNYLVDEASADEPFRFVLGTGEMLPALEELLLGMGVGVKGTFIVPPEESFGAVDPANVHQMPKEEFGADFSYKVGDVVGFDTPTGDQLLGHILEIDEQSVTVDFNHPLAGEPFQFVAEIIEIHS